MCSRNAANKNPRVSNTLGFLSVLGGLLSTLGRLAVFVSINNNYISKNIKINCRWPLTMIEYKYKK